MDIIFQKKDIEEASSAARGIASDTTVLPLLTNVLITAKENDNKIEIIASNLDSFIKCSIPAEIKEPGTTTVPAQKFNQIITELPDGNIFFKYDGTKVIISCPENSYKLAILPPDDFPKWPSINPLSSFEMSQKDLKHAVEFMLFSIAAKDPRKVLLGGLFDLRDNSLRNIATDGRRLSFYETDIPEISGKTNIKPIIPQRILSEIQKFLKDEGMVKIEITEKQISFIFGNYTYTSKLIEGTYPNYENVIPKEFMSEIILDSDSFNFALRRAAILTDEKFFGIIMRFSENKVELQSNINDLGSFDGYCPIKYVGEEFIIVFNYKNLLEIFRLLGKGEIELKIKGSEAPALLKSKNTDKAFFIVMPIKLSDIPPQDVYRSDEDKEPVYKNNEYNNYSAEKKDIDDQNDDEPSNIREINSANESQEDVSDVKSSVDDEKMKKGRKKK